MKEYLKSQIKNLPFIVIVFVLLYGITTFATSYLFDSSRVKFDTTGTDIQAGDVQGAIGELYTAANNFTTYDTRLQGIESTIGSGTLDTTSQNLIGAVNGLNDQISLLNNPQDVSADVKVVNSKIQYLWGNVTHKIGRIVIASFVGQFASNVSGSDKIMTGLPLPISEVYGCITYGTGSQNYSTRAKITTAGELYLDGSQSVSSTYFNFEFVYVSLN